MPFNIRQLTSGSAFLGYGAPTPITDELHPYIKDDVFTHQASTSDFAKIDAETLLRADVCTNSSNANKAIRASHKLGIIDPGTGYGDTTRIDRSLVNEMASISARKQRQFVQLMFFLEEEVTRWRMLTVEEKNLQAIIDSEGSNGANLPELKLTLAKIRADKTIIPSKREASGELHTAPDDEHLPRYEDISRA